MVTTGSQSGKWYSSSCNGVDGSNSYICEMPTTTNGTIKGAESCVNYDGYCYYTTHDAPLEVAESICQENNGHVASINSQHENDFIKNTFSSVYFLMLCAREYFPNVYAWSDGSLFEDFDKRYQFDIADNTRPCLVMTTDTGLWMRAGCDIQQSFVCKVPLEPKTIEGNSHCNSTMLMAPTTITSYGYNIGSEVFTPCTYQIISPGPYFIQIYFVDIQNSTVEVFDENGNEIALATSRTTVYASSNFVTVVHKSGGLFKAKVLVA
ncbi:hypothetical protein GCK72_020524 [Caenorhabditis remanei]|uniref:C-type lectin domain-containing protein n=1 Tax=Caenorhabditis remanei TaxID=31234 RepID=A0A6A5GFF7_CAERE|nr:hypothetical protein GCK72_020524 [Caenorhabditis remanei]KAF1753967.1 hypothetical protein GCK72_020524 [Caenorhabditis remanei]